MPGGRPRGVGVGVCVRWMNNTPLWCGPMISWTARPPPRALNSDRRIGPSSRLTTRLTACVCGVPFCRRMASCCRRRRSCRVASAIRRTVSCCRKRSCSSKEALPANDEATPPAVVGHCGGAYLCTWCWPLRETAPYCGARRPLPWCVEELTGRSGVMLRSGPVPTMPSPMACMPPEGPWRGRVSRVACVRKVRARRVWFAKPPKAAAPRTMS